MALLAAMMAAALLSTQVLGRHTAELLNLLEQAQTLAAQDDWEGARSLTERALEKWEGWSTHFYIVLHHGEADQVSCGFYAVLEHLREPEAGAEYAAANATLMEQIRLLHEMEQLTLKNVL